MFRQQPRAFLSLPRGPAYDQLRQVVQDALARHGVEPVTEDDVLAAASSAETTDLELLRDTDFLVADVTEGHPNVMLEVGMAIGMGKQLLLLAHGRSRDLPAALRTRQVAVYDAGDVASVDRYLDIWLRDVTTASDAAEA